MRTKLLILSILLAARCSAQVKDDTDKALTLSGLSLDKLMNIQVVTASGYLQTTEEAPSTITVITDQQIKERGYEQLEDALRDIPGIDMIHINGYAPTLIYFRGMYGAENLRALLMIDGIVENDIIGSNDMAGPAYSLHNVDRIEIIWGPASALYGANAYGGVINIITKKGNDINGLHIEKGYGTFNTSFEKFDMGAKKANLEYSLAGTLYSTDGPSFKNRDPQYHASFVDKAYSVLGSVSFISDCNKTTIGFRNYRTPMGWGTYSNSPTTYLGLPAQGNQNSGVLGVITRDFMGENPGVDDSYLNTYYIQNEFCSSKNFNFLARLTYRETGTADDSYIYITIDGKRLIHANIATYSNRISGEFSANYSLSDKQRFSAGLQYTQDNVEHGARRSTFDSSLYIINGRDTLTNLNSVFLPRIYDIRTTFGSYLQYVLNTNLLGKTNFTAGVRYDYNSYFGSSANPRLVIVNQPDEKFTFKLQFGTAFRAPTNLEITQVPSTFTLKTEKIRTYEANAIYVFSKRIKMQLNVFNNNLTDVIILSNLSGFIANKNPGKINVTGMEGNFDLFFSKYLSGNVNFTYQDTRGENLITHVQRSVSAIAHIKGNAGITAYINDAFIINLTGNYVGKRPTPLTDPFGPVPGYFLTNCNISTGKLFNKNITASFNIHNIFDVKWLDPGFRTADGFLYSTVLEQPGRTCLIKISVDL